MALARFGCEARAHEAVPGVTGFGALLLHPVFVVEEALVFAAAGLLLASQAGAASVAASVSLVAGLAAGGILYTLGLPPPLTWAAPYAAAAAAGLIVVLDLRLPRRGGAVVFAALGFGAGPVAAQHAAGWAALAETLAAAAIAGAAIMVGVGWTGRALIGVFGRIPIRVAGSWLTAVAAMVLALVLRMFV